ncbi:MAG: hypothetical protein K2X87_02620 [Gemmataceae bacterium]|nr:hypothetical protein [Gemmataceae bacterium]
MTRPTTKTAKPGLTQLEAREVPALVTFDNGTLTVFGTNSDETSAVRQTASAITVEGVSGSYAPSAVTEIRVEARGGDDYVTLRRPGAVVSKPTAVWLGCGADYVIGGNGANYVDGGTGNDVLYGYGGADKLAGDTGDDTLYGGTGNDQLAGGAGADRLQGDAGGDRMDGGRQYDTYVNAGSGDHVYDDVYDGILIGGVVIGSGYALHGGRSDFGWFDEYLGDEGIRREARGAERNGSVGRAEMIDILEVAGDGGMVDAVEYGDLNEVVAADEVTIPGSVRQLARKALGHDPANYYFTGRAATRQAKLPFGVGTSDARLQQLVDKWFRGADLPAARDGDGGFGYQGTAGSLFVRGPAASDIDQGGLGDCYLMTALGAIARQDPDRIEDMFADNGDGTFTVRFFDGEDAEYVTVDRRLPVDGSGDLVFAGDGRDADDATNELWVALAEKAYAQLNESGWTGQDGTNSYKGVVGVAGSDGIDGSNTGVAMQHVAGVSASYHGMYWTSFADVREAFDAGRAIAFGTVDEPPNGDVVGSHAYIMVGYDAATQRIILRNPWGANDDVPVTLSLSIAQLEDNFNGWHGAYV